MKRVDQIRERLQRQLEPTQLDVIDDSHKHVGHAGARDGRGHFRVRIVSAAFADHTTVQRHRMVYDAVGELMHTDIHALSVEAKTEEES